MAPPSAQSDIRTFLGGNPQRPLHVRLAEPRARSGGAPLARAAAAFDLRYAYQLVHSYATLFLRKD